MHDHNKAECWLAYWKLYDVWPLTETSNDSCNKQSLIVFPFEQVTQKSQVSQPFFRAYTSGKGDLCVVFVFIPLYFLF